MPTISFTARLGGDGECFCFLDANEFAGNTSRLYDALTYASIMHPEKLLEMLGIEQDDNRRYRVRLSVKLEEE